jgi:hypothetical protein
VRSATILGREALISLTSDGIPFTAGVVMITAVGIELPGASLTLPAAVQEIEADGRIIIDVLRDMPAGEMSRRFDVHRVTLDLQDKPSGSIHCLADVMEMSADTIEISADVMEIRADAIEIPAEVMEIPAEVTGFTADGAEISS